MIFINRGTLENTRSSIFNPQWLWRYLQKQVILLRSFGQTEGFDPGIWPIRSLNITLTVLHENLEV